MTKYDGLIIPRSYSDYLNKTDGATLSQMLDSIGGTFDASPTPNSVKPARSGGIFAASAVITSDSTTLTGVTISAGSVVRVLFTAALTGNDATTGLQLTYNGTAYAVKAGKDGALVALTAHLIEESFVYLQAYTTLELAFDGSQFVIMGNPVVISNVDFSIMADGSIIYKRVITQNTVMALKFPKTYTQRQVFYDLRDYSALADENGALNYVLGNVDGVTFNNIYQLNGVRYFRNGEQDVYHVQWNVENVTDKEITIFFVKVS